MPAAEKTAETLPPDGAFAKGKSVGRRRPAISALEVSGGSEHAVLEAVQSQVEALPGKLNFKIGEAARLLGLKPHALRFWESKFPVLKPKKLEGGQRLYFKQDMEILFLIKALLDSKKLTLRGAGESLPVYFRLLRRKRLKAQDSVKSWRKQRRLAKTKLYQLLDSIAEAKARIKSGSLP